MSLVPSPANSTSLAALKERTRCLPPETPLSFFSAGGLDLMQRAATMLSCSTLVPTAYRAIIEKKVDGKTTPVKNDSALSNCVLALNMAQRIGADPLMIMQNLYIVEGRPGWSSQFVIASINACGKFSPLRFKMEDLGEKEVEWKTTKWVDVPNGRRMPKEETHKATIRNKACTAWAIEKATGDKIEGPTVSMETAVAEGWFGKNGSKWQTMPDVMLRYRAASFFGKLYAPELLMGLQTAEEVRDATIVMEAGEDGSFEMSLADIEATEETIKEPEAKAAPPEPAKVEAPETEEKQKPAEEEKKEHRKTRPLAREKQFPCIKETENGEPKMVTREDCFYCLDNEGCPNRA